MGREIRHMALDFDWPLGKVWKGYLNPHYEKCPVCPGSQGYTPEYKEMEAFVRRIMLAASASDERPEDYVPTKEGPHSLGLRMWGGGITEITEEEPRWPFKTDPVKVLAAIAGEDPTAGDAWLIRRIAHFDRHPGMWKPQMAEYQWSVDDEGNRVRKTVLTPSGDMYYPHPYLVEEEGIADVGTTFHEFARKLGLKPGFMGWDGEFDFQKAIIEYHGDQVVEYTYPAWCICQTCKGDGLHPDAKEDYEEWKSYEPPKGEGYQLWSTTTGGHPMSPVFETPEELATWLTENNVSTFGGQVTTYENWLKFIKGPGWAMSMVGIESTGELKTGVDFAVGETK